MNSTEKKRVRGISGFLMIVGLCGLMGCQTKTSVDARSTQSEKGLSEAQESEKAPEKEIISSMDEAMEAEGLLLQMTEAIEQQFPGQTFSDSQEENSDMPPILEDSYVFSARTSSDGFRYVAGVRIAKENPLEGWSCGTAQGISGFQINQFDEGKILLLQETGDETSGLSYLYEALQRGFGGIAYMEDAGKRGVTLVPPSDSPFLKVSMIKEGFRVTEFIPLTKAMAAELKEGEQTTEETGRGKRIALCESRDDLSKVWLSADQAPTERMEALAIEKCGFDTLMLSDIKELKKAVLKVGLYGEEREETLENRDDLERLWKILAEAEYGEMPYDREFSGILTLTGADGTVFDISLAMESGGFMLGNSVFCQLSSEETDKIWSLFTMLRGWKEYGSRIYMEMNKESYTAEDKVLDFRLLNDMGKEIHFSLSPVIYKKAENTSGIVSWERIDTIAGVCGTFTPLREAELPLEIPWKDAYDLKGPGTYKLEIQAIPEKDIRFEISDTFELQ